MIASGSLDSDREFTEAVYAVYIQAAVDDSGKACVSELCAEGAFEPAIGEIRTPHLRTLTEGR